MQRREDDLSVMNLVGANAIFAFGKSSYRNGAIFGPLRGCQLEAIFIQTGQVEVRHDNHAFVLSSPGVAIVGSQKTLEYRYGPADMCNVLWCQYISGGLRSKGIEKMLPLFGPVGLSEAAKSLFKVGADIHTDLYAETQNFSSSLGITVLEELIARKKIQESVANIPVQALRVRRYIEDNYSSNITMNILAKASGLSPQHLNRLYRAAFNENPLDHLWRLRVRRGAYLLRHTGMRISQIAYQTGFKTPNHFSRLIRQKYESSPKELRAKKWQGEMVFADK